MFTDNLAGTTVLNEGGVLYVRVTWPFGLFVRSNTNYPYLSLGGAGGPGRNCKFERRPPDDGC